jgi:hypothetical protein
MPRTATDYSRTVIYRIKHIENKELVYVGSTTNFTKRKCSHKSICYNEKSKRYNFKLYVMIRENQGWNAFQKLEIKTLITMFLILLLYKKNGHTVWGVTLKQYCFVQEFF